MKKNRNFILTQLDEEENLFRKTLERGIKQFEKLIKEHAEYIATYYHLAHLYIDFGEDELAKSTFEKGIEVASKNNESLALRELQSAYDEFMM